jgi:hypothetical protein
MVFDHEKRRDKVERGLGMSEIYSDLPYQTALKNFRHWSHASPALCVVIRPDVSATAGSERRVRKADVATPGPNRVIWIERTITSRVQPEPQFLHLIFFCGGLKRCRPLSLIALRESGSSNAGLPSQRLYVFACRSVFSFIRQTFRVKLSDMVFASAFMQQDTDGILQYPKNCIFCKVRSETALFGYNSEVC